MRSAPRNKLCLQYKQNSTPSLIIIIPNMYKYSRETESIPFMAKKYTKNLTENQTKNYVFHLYTKLSECQRLKCDVVRVSNQ